MHSGCNGGKKWQIIVKEKYGCVEAVIFDSKTVFKELNRPQKAVDLLEDFLFEQPTFRYEDHALYVNKKWFSLDSISRGLHKIGEVFNQPLVFKEEKK